MEDTVWVRDYRTQEPKWSLGIVTQVLGPLTYHVSLPQWGVTWKRHIDQLRPRVDPPSSTDHFGMTRQIVPEANDDPNHCTESPPGAFMSGETSHNIENYQGTRLQAVSTAESPVSDNQFPVVSMDGTAFH